MEPILLEFGLW